MKRFFQSEVGAAMAWVFGSLVLAAWITPWVYHGGKLLASMAAGQDLPAMLEWLGAACGRSKFSRFFNRSMLFSALVLLPLVLRRITTLRAATGNPALEVKPQVSWKSAALQITLGCVIAGGLLCGLGGLLDAAGVFVPKSLPLTAGKLLSKILIPAAAVSLLEEWLFRGLLLGLWLRSVRPATACLGTSLLFAFLHFMAPPDGTFIKDPAQVLAGFELLGKILLHFTDPLFFVTDFAALLAGGLILAWARVRTGALWFSIGLHAGWIMVFKGFNLLYQVIPGHPLHPWGVGDNLRSGILPLLTLGITAVICHFALRRFSTQRSSC